MNLVEILGILFIHWIADFVLQTDTQAKNKSTSFYWLCGHTAMYTLVWTVIGAFYTAKYNFTEQGIINLLLFVVITFTAHTITDYFTSRLNSRLWSAGKVHNFFVSIGFDQWLHYAQLFITYWYLTR